MASERQGPLRILLLSDERPGHYHLSEGVVAAAKRLTGIECHKVCARRRRILPGCLLSHMRQSYDWPPERHLKFGYGVNIKKLPAIDLVVSAGGDTLIPNVDISRSLGVPNIFCGSLRQFKPDDFSLIVTSYKRWADSPRHIVVVKPNAMDPDTLGRPDNVPQFGHHNPPKIAGLLIGGNSGLFTYRRDEWNRLLRFMLSVTEAWGTRWIVSTSRRTENWLGDEIAKLARLTDAIAEFIDYRKAGPGTLPDLFARSDILVCTEDSSSMISEAVCVRMPVIGVAPESHEFKSEEADYRKFLLENDWVRYVLIGGLSVDRLAQVLGEVKPRNDNHLDHLAGLLKTRLPDVFGGNGAL